MTLREFSLRMKAQRLANVDRDFWAHWQAYLSFMATGTKKSGKKAVPVYSNFRKFFDYDRELSKAESKPRKASRFEGIGKVIKKYE